MNAFNSHRRAFLQGLGTGLGGLCASSLWPTVMRAADARGGRQAKHVIWLFMRGGVSHMESFDPKPALNRYAGKTIAETPFKSVQDPERLKEVRVVVVNDANGQQRNEIYPLQVGSKKYGQAGVEVSDWFPHLGGCVDDLAVIRSMWTTDDNHGAQVQFHSGRHMLDVRVPTIGAWVSFGLRTLNVGLPEFVSMGPRFFDKRDGHYLGPAFDAVPLSVGSETPLPYAKPEGAMSPREQRLEFDLVRRLNEERAQVYPRDNGLLARKQAYDLAFHMQTAIPEILDYGRESAATRSLYGFDQDHTRPFGQQLLGARRLIERGVRFVQIMHGDGAAGAWDSHAKLKANHSKLAAQVDLPAAGLIKDLKQRGLFDETIVVFATEFGRTPGSQNADGRDHHPFGFSIWMAGGGIRGGVVHGATDEIGFHAVEDRHYVTDVHATLLHQLGLDHRSLEVPGHKRLDRDFGHVMHKILA